MALVEFKYAIIELSYNSKPAPQKAAFHVLTSFHVCSFTVYVTLFLVYRATYCRAVGLLINTELKRVWKETIKFTARIVAINFKAVSFGIGLEGLTKTTTC